MDDDNTNINYNNYFISSVESNKKKNKSKSQQHKLDDIDIICDMGYKLSNQEKNILKRLKN